jgi:arylsulfatase A
MQNSGLSRRELLKTLGAGAAGACLATLFGSGILAEGDKKPNIILILDDDLGIEAIGSYGGKSYKTPNIDALAESGTRFENCFCTPVCSPSRVELMTGKYPFRTGWTTLIGWGGEEQDDYFDPTKDKTFAHLMKSAGYRTAVAGKWQLCKFPEQADHPTQCGFDEHCLWTWKYQDKKTSRYWSPSIWENGKLRENTAGKYGPDVFQEFCESFIERNAKQPFFLYYPMVLTHAPWAPTPDNKHDKKELGTQDLFKGNVEYMDKLVGRIVDTVERLKLRENTIIIYTADNGTDARIKSVMGERDISGGKAQMLDTGSHVPLIVSWKGKTPAGKISDDLIDFSDFLPTFAKLGGVEIPAGIDGQSFEPQLRGEAGKNRDWVYVQLDNKRFIRNKQWKLHGDGKLLSVDKTLHERSADASPEAQAARKFLQAELDKLTKTPSK